MKARSSWNTFLKKCRLIVLKHIGGLTLGKEHPSYVIRLNNLAWLYHEQAQYKQAESLNQQATEICRKALGDKHPDYALRLNNLACIYHDQGNYSQAESLYQQACEIYRKVLGEYHPDYARSLDNLAGLYHEQGNYVQAEHLHLKTSKIYRKALGEDHPSYATSLANLARLDHDQGNYVQAEHLHLKTSKIYRKALGEDHPSYANSLANLAGTYFLQGLYTQAIPQYRQACEIRRQAFGDKHPVYAKSLFNLGKFLAAINQVDEALSNMESAERIYDHMIIQIIATGSERRQLAYLASLQSNVHVFLSLILEHYTNSPDVVGKALNLVLRRKGIVADVLKTQREAVLVGQYPHLKSKLELLGQWRRQIAEKTLAGPEKETLQSHQDILTEWQAHQEALETELARDIPELNFEQRLQSADFQTVAQHLPEKAVLVEFMRFERYNFNAIPANGDDQWQGAHYIAFLIPSGEADPVRMIDLGKAEPIDHEIAEFRAQVTRDPSEKRIGPGPAIEKEPDSPNPLSAGQALRTRVFDLIRSALTEFNVSLDEIPYLILAPDGELNRLPFEVLPQSNGHFLGDDYRISYLSTGRDVLRLNRPARSTPHCSLVIADPDYDLTDNDESSLIGEELFPGVCASFRATRHFEGSGLFNRLPGTLIEGERIAWYLNVEPCLDAKALKGFLESQYAPPILHIATHGTFAEKLVDDKPHQASMLETEAADMPVLDNPLLRSMLALAGANTGLKQGSLPKVAGNGLLTAEDATALDLVGTELVVLSACETGLGELVTGEGVFGLRRAFAIAGANTLVMSLWKVPDLATAILMDQFYENLLTHHQPRDQALQNAKNSLRYLTVGEMKKMAWLTEKPIDQITADNPEENQEMKYWSQCSDDFCPFASPSYWGAFICQGDVSPLPDGVVDT